jgi:hypothetical protein
MFKGINRVMRAYIYWDLVINSAWGFLAPVFTIFLLEKIAGGNVIEGVKIAGFATLAYWITKSILQIPIGNYLDKNHGEIDDFWFYVVGTIMTALVPIGYLFSYLPWHIYALQVFHAIAMSMVIPASYAIFIRHTDKGREAYESSLDSTLLGVGVGITGALGGIMAAYLGFTLLFLLTSLLNLVAVLFIFPVRNEMLPKMPQGVHKLPTGNDK